jgi:hypothetical protein
MRLKLHNNSHFPVPPWWPPQGGFYVGNVTSGEKSHFTPRICRNCGEKLPLVVQDLRGIPELDRRRLLSRGNRSGGIELRPACDIGRFARPRPERLAFRVVHLRKLCGAHASGQKQSSSQNNELAHGFLRAREHAS